jgi:hypothetical protein
VKWPRIEVGAAGQIGELQHPVVLLRTHCHDDQNIIGCSSWHVGTPSPTQAHRG